LNPICKVAGRNLGRKMLLIRLFPRVPLNRPRQVTPISFPIYHMEQTPLGKYEDFGRGWRPKEIDQLTNLWQETI